ncbi:SpoIIE family protein phosphatase [Mycobacterium deserti]|uniref:SpoIIE family protein phosphatase n=1 Tax=Mycobacterium deserti TaxID=2978347 RepID=A0ABT2MGV8_9MYCO|nr:SpoIIE family protein phosphatase [Mycobacterium deserti]MCT7661462.1 SpoIIE family protein phosphatase [Mycobacterium deserti]
MFRNGRFGPIEWAATRRPRPDESVCGDLPVALEIGTGAALFGALDGLGHGEPAAAAAQCAAEVLERARAEPLDVVVQLCHRALTETRGVAMTLARIDFDTDTMSWIGIGNVAANLVAKGPTGAEMRSSVFLAGGIVGYRMPQPLLTHQVGITPGDLLVVASDGISARYVDSIDFSAPATEIAQQILADHSREVDDALVLAARHRGST